MLYKNINIMINQSTIIDPKTGKIITPIYKTPSGVKENGYDLHLRIFSKIYDNIHYDLDHQRGLRTNKKSSIVVSFDKRNVSLLNDKGTKTVELYFENNVFGWFEFETRNDALKWIELFYEMLISKINIPFEKITEHAS